jgi:hypothetical protein
MEMEMSLCVQPDLNAAVSWLALHHEEKELEELHFFMVYPFYGSDVRNVKLMVIS